MNNKLIILLLVLVLFTPFVSAETSGYYTSLQLEQVISTNGNNTWSTPYKFTLNLTESKSAMGVTINYYDIGNSNTAGLFRITGGSISDIMLTKNQASCIKGTCPTNLTNSGLGDTRLTLLDIIPITVTGNASTTDNPIYAYLYANKELALTKNGEDTFDASEYFKQETGWSSDKSTSEISIYFKRLNKIPISVSVSTTKRDPRYEWSDDKVRYIIEESGKYTFTVKYNSVNMWGAITEKIDTYTITIKGIVLASTPLTVSAPYEMFLSESKTVTMSAEGKFTPLSGMTATNTGGNSYTIKFDSPGTYAPKYTAKDGGDVTVNFIVKPNQQPISPTPTVVANQQLGSFGNDTIIYVVGAIAVLGILLYVIKKRKGGGSSSFIPRNVQ